MAGFITLQRLSLVLLRLYHEVLNGNVVDGIDLRLEDSLISCYGRPRLCLRSGGRCLSAPLTHRFVIIILSLFVVRQEQKGHRNDWRWTAR
jgi:hypothetical protein